MIHARGLVQTFQTGRGNQRSEVRAVDGVDLDVADGEVVGFLGPNGAGKTTTLRILTTLLRPTSGTARVAGYDVATQPVDVRRSIGYCSQVGSTFSGAYAGDEVVDHGMLYGMSREDAVASGQQLFDRLHLEGLWRRMPKNMSGGQKRRLDIAMALSTRRGWSSSTSRRRGSTRRRGRTCGSTSVRCARIRASRCSSPRTTWTRPTCSPTGS
jgi:ABC-2 type transport system ATP-binding protein